MRIQYIAVVLVVAVGRNEKGGYSPATLLPLSLSYYLLPSLLLIYVYTYTYLRRDPPGVRLIDECVFNP